MRLERALQNKRAPWIALGAGVFIVLLVTPGAWTRAVQSNPSSFNDDPYGVSGFYRVASSLGWRTERRLTSSLSDLDGGVLVSLSPDAELTPSEVHLVLEQVRAGAGLLASADGSAPLADSLGLVEERLRSQIAHIKPGRNCRATQSAPASLFTVPGYMNVLDRFPQGAMRDSVGEFFFPLEFTFSEDGTIPVRRPRHTFKAAGARGFRYGFGHIVMMTSPEPLRNDVFRQCTVNAAQPAVQALTYLAGGRNSRLIFDEYRQGYGQRIHLWTAIGEILVSTSSGRGLAQLALAGVIFLAGAAVRDVPPRPRVVIERRSPFEHVEALAVAYSRAGATTLAARRLMQGLRRRLPVARTSGSAKSDQFFLESLAASDPAVAADTARVRDALISRIPNAELAAVGKAVENIERSVKG